MSDHEEKPARKKLTLTPKPEGDKAERKRKPARWSPLQKNRSLEVKKASQEAKPARPLSPSPSPARGEGRYCRNLTGIHKESKPNSDISKTDCG
jgi:hypothetical protein